MKGFGKFASSPQAKALFTNLSATLRDTHKMVRSINNELAPILVNMNSALKEIKESADSFRVLTQYLSTHPEALITGKKRKK